MDKLTTNESRRLKLLIQTLLLKIVNHYQKIGYHRQRAKTFREIVKVFGLLKYDLNNENKKEKKSAENTANSKWTVHRRLKFVRKNIKYHDATLGDTIDLVSKYIGQTIDENENVKNIIQNDMSKIFLREQCLLNKEYDNNWDNMCKVVFGGIIQGFSSRDFEKINHFV